MAKDTIGSAMIKSRILTHTIIITCLLVAGSAQAIHPLLSAYQQSISYIQTLPAAPYILNKKVAGVSVVIALLWALAKYTTEFVPLSDLSLSDYTQLNHAQQQAATQGLQDIHALQTNPACFDHLSPADMLKKIINIQWHLYSCAVTKNQPFKHGTIVFQDPSDSIYNFLIKYVKRVNRKLTGTHADAFTVLSVNPFAYARLSSHFRFAQRTHRQYGIDIRMSKKQSAQPLLPTHKRHLLFGCSDANQHLYFVKWEDSGLYFDDFIHHSMGFLRYLARKHVGSLDSILSGRLFNACALAVGSFGDPNIRQERVQRPFKRKCKDLITRAQLPDTEKDLLLTAINNFGMRTLHDYVQMLSNNPPLSPQQLTLLATGQQYLNELQQIPNVDNIPLRSGNEVVLRSDEWLLPLDQTSIIH